MFRRKPPSLSPLEELQQTYDDCCNITIRNLAYEDSNRVSDALRGWKLLHTLVLYKIDAFDKQRSKLSSDEAQVLDELKAIRDENVKHLIRVQLRVDEEKRRAGGGSSGGSGNPVPKQKAAASSGGAPGTSLSIPSLRNTNTPQSRSLTSSGSLQPRLLLKLLRPQGPVRGHSEAASKAATVSWPKLLTRRLSAPVRDSDADMFADFDQMEWDANRDAGARESAPKETHRHRNRGPQGYLGASGRQHNGHSLRQHALLSQLSLPGTAEEPGPSPNQAQEYPYPHAQTHPHNYPQNDPPSISLIDLDSSVPAVSASMNDLGLKKLPPPPPKSRNTRLEATKSAPEIPRVEPEERAEPKEKYVYKKPVPLNVNGMMKRAQNPQTRAKKPANITYNYVPKGKKPAAANANPALNTALSSQLLNANQKTSQAPKQLAPVSGSDAPLDSPDLSADPELLRQQQLISSIKGIDENAARQILNDIVVRGDEVHWDDIVGLDSAKSSLKEAVVYPFLRPDLFQGLREPTRGMLLFGPPGTGKTMLARAVATESKSTFFSISSSSLTSKYLGESEKLVKALFLVARKLAPSIVFIDEIDSLLSSRSDGENDSTRRIKNEFLIQWSELSSAAAGRHHDDVSRVLILGATNLPWSIDEAARRRFVRRQYIPLPEPAARRSQIEKLLRFQKHTLLEDDYAQLMSRLEGFSGSDITALAKDAAMGPLRALGDRLLDTPPDHIRPINLVDFESSLTYIRPSVLAEGLDQYEQWAAKFGSSGA